MTPLVALLKGVDACEVRQPQAPVEISRVTLDSRRAQTGTLFVAARGVTATSRDGHDFIASVVSVGVRAVVVETGREEDARKAIGDSDVALYSVDSPRETAAQLAERVFGEPSRALRVIGITGTNGKTTTSFVLAQALNALQRDAAVFGTLGVGRPNSRVTFGFTTPEAEVVSERLATLVADGVQDVAMEVSSHALATARTEAVHFAVAAFTNFTQDHLDFHGDMTGYLAAKARLFHQLLPVDGVAVLPAHLPAIMAAALPTAGRVLTWSPTCEETAADVCASDVVATMAGLSFRFHHREACAAIESPLVGRFNVENLLVAGACLLGLGFSLEDVARGLSAAEGVPGRMERVANEPLVVVDFAHTPDALTRALKSMRVLTQGRLIVVFGAGGDRDPSKRALMGQAAAKLADAVVLTSDNPRHENGDDIISELETGVRAAGMKGMKDAVGFVKVSDRAEAIAFALNLASDGDAILIAGKGDERAQIIGDQKRPFVDRDVVRALFAGGDA